MDISKLDRVEMLELWMETMFCLPIPGIGDHLEVARSMRRDLLWEKAKIGVFGGSAFKPGLWSDAVTLSCKAKVQNDWILLFVSFFFF